LKLAIEFTIAGNGSSGLFTASVAALLVLASLDRTEKEYFCSLLVGFVPPASRLLPDSDLGNVIEEEDLENGCVMLCEHIGQIQQ